MRTIQSPITRNIIIPVSILGISCLGLAIVFLSWLRHPIGSIPAFEIFHIAIMSISLGLLIIAQYFRFMESKRRFDIIAMGGILTGSYMIILLVFLQITYTSERRSICPPGIDLSLMGFGFLFFIVSLYHLIKQRSLQKQDASALFLVQTIIISAYALPWMHALSCTGFVDYGLLYIGPCTVWAIPLLLIVNIRSSRHWSELPLVARLGYAISLVISITVSSLALYFVFTFFI